MRAALPASLKLHYAMKANPMPALVCHLTGLVDGIDVASGGELKVALDAGAAPRAISFAGPGKRCAELQQAVACGILVNVESFREVAGEYLLEILREQTSLPPTRASGRRRRARRIAWRARDRRPSPAPGDACRA